MNFAIDSIRAMWSGSLAWTTPVLEPGASAAHITYVSFTASGKYGIGLSASFSPEEGNIIRGGGGANGGTAGNPTVNLDSERGARFGGLKGLDTGGAPMIYWGHEALEVVITEVGEEGKKGGGGGGQSKAATMTN